MFFSANREAHVAFSVSGFQSCFAAGNVGCFEMRLEGVFQTEAHITVASAQFPVLGFRSRVLDISAFLILDKKKSESDMKKRIKKKRRNSAWHLPAWRVGCASAFCWWAVWVLARAVRACKLLLHPAAATRSARNIGYCIIPGIGACCIACAPWQVVCLDPIRACLCT